MNKQKLHIENNAPVKKLLLSKSEEERLREDVFRPDMEKFLLFTRMLRRNAMIKKAKITHKQ